MKKITRTRIDAEERWEFSAREVRETLGIPEDARVYLILNGAGDIDELHAVRRNTKVAETD